MNSRFFTTLVGLIAGLFLVSCAEDSPKVGGVSSKAGKPDEVSLKSGEIVQLAFSSDGKGLVVANEYRAYGEHRKEHSRLRRFATSDWKLTADTGEISISLELRKLDPKKYPGYKPTLDASISDLFVASSKTGPWLLQGMWLNRNGPDNAPAWIEDKGAAFLTLDPITLKMTIMDIDLKSSDEFGRIYRPLAVAVNPTYTLGVLEVEHGPPPLPPFVFDLKTGGKKAELADFPDSSNSPQKSPDEDENAFQKSADGDYYIHTEPLLEFTPDNEHIVSFITKKPYQLQLHEVRTGKLIRSLKTESEYSIGSMKLSPDGKMLAGLCWNGDVLIMAPDLTKKIRKLKVLGSDIPLFQHAIAFLGNDHLAVVSGRKTVEVFDTKEWKKVASFPCNDNRLNCVAGSADGKLLAAGYGETTRMPGVVRVWELATKTLVAELK